MTVKKDGIKEICKMSIWGGGIFSIIMLGAMLWILISMIKIQVPSIVIAIVGVLYAVDCCFVMVSAYFTLYKTVYRIDRDEDKFIFHTYRELYIIEAHEVSFDKKKFKWIVPHENKKLYVYNKIPRSWATECFAQEEIEMLIRE